MRQRSWWGLPLTALAIGFIAWFTLRPSPGDISMAARTDFSCLVACGGEELRDTILNILLFLPLGFALAQWLPRWAALLVCIAATCGIEFTQWGWLAGRDSSLRDLLTNTLGGALGIWLAVHWRAVVTPRRSVAPWLAGGASLGWLALVGLTAIGVQPSLPRTTWWGQWAPELGQFELWRGTLLAAEVNGIVIPNGEARNSPELRRELGRDPVLVTAQIRTGPMPSEAAPIVSIFDADQREIFVLGQRGADLFFRVRTGLFAIGLRGQLVHLSGALALPPGEPVTVRGGIVDHGWQLEVSSASGTRRWHAPWSAGLLWTGLLPAPYPIGATTPLLNALWLGATLLPAGYWLVRTTSRARALALVLLVIGLGLGVLVPLAGLSPPPPLEWLGSVFGAALGGLAGALTPRREPVPASAPALTTTLS